jgi:hypothetical protein
LRDVVAFAFRHPPRGLARALGRLGETLWAGPEYDALFVQLRAPDAAQVLQHADAIDIALLHKLALLPAALRKMRIVALLPHPYAADTLAEAFALARRINPRRSERDLAMAWGRAADAKRLFEAAIDALKADRFGQFAPAPAMGKPYRAITARAVLDVEALRFRNCIASYVVDIGADVMAVYVREGEPAAMIALKRDVGGWRLAEALAAENAPLPEQMLRAIAADFAAAGVRVGQPVRAIEDRLETLAEATPATPAQPATVAARLGLGQLWR